VYATAFFGVSHPVSARAMLTPIPCNTNTHATHGRDHIHTSDLLPLVYLRPNARALAHELTLTLAPTLDCAPHTRPRGTLQVHCSAGIGRTGSFIAVDHGLRLFEETCVVSVITIVKNLRKDRGGMVQHWEQAEFVQNTLQAYVISLARNVMQIFFVRFLYFSLCFFPPCVWRFCFRVADIECPICAAAPTRHFSAFV
jgi:hypothetical protein